MHRTKRLHILTSPKKPHIFMAVTDASESDRHR
jgi:hypothetical protein